MIDITNFDLFEMYEFIQTLKIYEMSFSKTKGYYEIDLGIIIIENNKEVELDKSNKFKEYGKYKCFTTVEFEKDGIRHIQTMKSTQEVIFDDDEKLLNEQNNKTK